MRITVTSAVLCIQCVNCLRPTHKMLTLPDNWLNIALKTFRMFKTKPILKRSESEFLSRYNKVVWILCDSGDQCYLIFIWISTPVRNWLLCQIFGGLVTINVCSVKKHTKPSSVLWLSYWFFYELLFHIANLSCQKL